VTYGDALLGVESGAVLNTPDVEHALTRVRVRYYNRRQSLRRCRLR